MRQAAENCRTDPGAAASRRSGCELHRGFSAHDATGHQPPGLWDESQNFYPRLGTPHLGIRVALAARRHDRANLAFVSGYLDEFKRAITSMSVTAGTASITLCGSRHCAGMHAGHHFVRHTRVLRKHAGHALFDLGVTASFLGLRASRSNRSSLWRPSTPPKIINRLPKLGTLDSARPAMCDHGSGRGPGASASFDHLVGESEQRLRDRQTEAVAVLRLMTSSNLVGRSIGTSPSFAPFQNFIHIKCRAPNHIVEFGP